MIVNKITRSNTTKKNYEVKENVERVKNRHFNFDL